MNTSLHVVFNVVFGNMYFVIVFFNIHGQKMRFSESTQNSISEKSIFGHFEVLFFNVWVFSRAGWLFPDSTFNVKYFNGKMSSLAGLKKSFLLSRKSTDFGNFWLPRSFFKVDFLNAQANFRKNLGLFPGAVLFGTLF